MSHLLPRRLALRLALPFALAGAIITSLVLLALPGPAAAALPASQTQCGGSLSPDSAGPGLGEPDLLDYSFYCNGGITAYTVLVDRTRTDGDNVDDYNPNPEVISAGQVSQTESVNCGGATPSNGINCYALNGAVAGFIQPGDLVNGSIDLTDQYCSHLPKGAKPGTPAIPRATVELVVTDSTGAEDGPFELFPQKACPKVPAVVPAPVKKTVKKRTHASHATATKARIVARSGR